MLRRSYGLALASAVLVLTLPGAVAQSATTTTARNADGSTRISIRVNPGTGVQDVHLCVARTKHTATEESTLAGDPLNKNYSNPAGAAGGTAALPGGWTYRGVVETQEPAPAGAPAGETTSLWCVTWNNPAAALPAAGFTFAVDYSGGKGDVKKSGKENVFLTSHGAVGLNPADVINGPAGGAGGGKKGEKGHMPTVAFTAAAPPLTFTGQPRLPSGQKRAPK